MNWFNSFYKISQHQSDDEINQIINACHDLVKQNGEIEKIKKIFPSALFQSTLRDDGYKKFGIKMAFAIKTDNVNVVFKRFQEYMSRNGVEINGYVIDNYNLFKLDENNKYIRAEGEPWFMHGTPLFEGGENIAYLIHYNIENNLKPELAWRKYKDRPEIIQAMSAYENLNDSQAFRNELFETDDERKQFIKHFRKVYFKENPDKFENSFQDMMFNLGRELKDEPKSKYEYDISMNPVEGKGKFISFDLIKQAYQKYGEFNVCIRYHGGRIIYKASQVLNFLNAAIDDTEAEEFHNQLGGIRDLFVA